MYKNILDEFYYSQNSINTFKSCPLKFKYKYIENLNWKYDDENSKDFYESLKSGTDFHLICERYFSNIPLGIENSNSKFINWMENIKKLIPINKENIYLPEYEIRYNKDNIKLQAKYDLIIIKENSIEIWDWKTESKKSNYKNVEQRMQTIVYMYLIKESINYMFNLDIDFENITMNYYQTEYDNKIMINYSEGMHKSFKNKIKSFLEIINTTNYDEENFELKNKNHCKFCEFNNLCNKEEVDNYDTFEEEIDEP